VGSGLLVPLHDGSRIHTDVAAGLKKGEMTGHRASRSKLSARSGKCMPFDLIREKPVVAATNA
jgi:hypothetical protein